MRDTTIINMPFAYEQVYIPPRHRLEQKTVLRSELPVEIHHYRDQDIPDFFRLSDHEYVTDYRTKFFGDRIYKKLFDSDRKTMMLETLAHNMSVISQGGHVRGAEYYTPKYGRPQNEMSVAQPNRIVDGEFMKSLGRLISDDMQHQLQRYADEYANSIISIDGEIWTSFKAPEPVIYLSDGFTKEMSYSFNHKRLQYLTHFSISKSDDAESFCELFERQSRHSVRRSIPRIQIFNDFATFDEHFSFKCQMVSLFEPYLEEGSRRYESHATTEDLGRYKETVASLCGRLETCPDAEFVAVADEAVAFLADNSNTRHYDSEHRLLSVLRWQHSRASIEQKIEEKRSEMDEDFDQLFTVPTM